MSSNEIESEREIPTNFASKEYHLAPPPPADQKGFDFGFGWRAHPQPTELAAIDRLIEICPGPWPAGEPLEPDVDVMSVSDDHAVLGYVAYRVREAVMDCPTISIVRVAVLPEWRQKGAGRYLLNELEYQYFNFDPLKHGRWAPTIRTATAVPKSCLAGRLFFAALGFRVVPGWDEGDSYLLERTRTVSGRY